MISTPTKCFGEKHSPNSPDFEGKKIKIEMVIFLQQVPANKQFFFKLSFFKLSHLVCSQIWLNLLVDDCKITLHTFFTVPLCYFTTQLEMLLFILAYL